MRLSLRLPLLELLLSFSTRTSADLISDSENELSQAHQWKNGSINRLPSMQLATWTHI